MSQEALVSGFPSFDALNGFSFLGREAGLFKNLDGSLVEPSTKRVSHKTANYTVLASESGTYFTNLGASGAVTFALPPATVGLHYTFKVRATQQLRIDPNLSETVELPSYVEQAAGAYIWADAKGEFIHLICLETGKWSAHNGAGTWTAV